MIISIHADDGQDFIIVFGEGSGGLAMATADCNKKHQPPLENFTIEEAQAIVGAINVAIKIALEERDAMEGLK